MNASEFDERYWQRADDAIPGRGFVAEQRKSLLKDALADMPPGAPVLDAGCGAGEFTAFLADLGFAVTGVDISAKAIASAQKRCPRGIFEITSLEDELPFADEEFAAIWCSEVLEHLFDVRGALTEFNRVLCPRAKLILTTPYHGIIKDFVIALAYFEKHYNPYGAHIRFFTRRSLATCLNQAGFAVERWGGIGRFWPLWKTHFAVARKARALDSMRKIKKIGR